MAINVYMDAAPIINLAKFKLRVKLTDNETDDALKTQLLLEAARDGNITVHTSFLTTVEAIHVGSRKDVAEEAKEFYDELLFSNEGGIHLVQPTAVIMNQARSLCWDHGVVLRGADLVHVMTAIFTKCTEFLTGDSRIHKQAVKLKSMGLEVLQARETKCIPPEYNQLDMVKDEGMALPEKEKPVAVLKEKGEPSQ